MRRVIIIGGGYAGLRAYNSCIRKMRGLIKKGEVSVSLISRDDYHTFHGWTGEVLSSLVPVESTLTPISEMLGDDFIKANVDYVDVISRKVTVSDRGRTRQLDYDHLVIATGSKDPLKSIEGAAEYAYRLKDTHDMQDMVARLQTGSAPKSVVVIGGGFAGVETASALAGRLGAGKVTLVSGEGGPLGSVEGEIPRLVEYARATLEKQGIRCVSGARVKEVSAETVHLSSGEVIAADMAIVTAGIEFDTLPGTEMMPRDAQGRLIVNDILRVQLLKGVWAVGDIAKVRWPGKDVDCPVDALWAIKEGDHVGANIARAIKGRSLKSFGFRGLGRSCGFAGRDGISEVYGMQFTGKASWLIRIVFFLWFMPGHVHTRSVFMNLMGLPDVQVRQPSARFTLDGVRQEQSRLNH